MKKIISMLILFSIIFTVSIPVISFETNAEEKVADKGTIFVNGVEIEDQFLIVEGLAKERTEDNRLVQTDRSIEVAYIPFQEIFEKLGATVDCEEDTNNILINYLGDIYICEVVVPDSYSPDDKYITIRNENINNGALGNYIQLNPMGAIGNCKIINDTIYLAQDAGQRLFETLGCSFDIDVEQRILKIYSPSGVGVTLNGTPINFDVTPRIENDCVLVPMRAIFEALGAQVDWEEETKTAVAQKDGLELRIQIDSDTMYKNGEPIRLDTPSRLIDDSTLVPIRAVSESFGAKVEWNEENKIVMISTEE